MRFYLEMRCPGRGRKRRTASIRVTSNHDLEMRCPGRGRKLGLPSAVALRRQPFGNEMPRKGTETVAFNVFLILVITKFGNEMPRKGTETFLASLTNTFYNLEMRCPGRGRKQEVSDRLLPGCENLEMRCPGRGRKPWIHNI